MGEAQQPPLNSMKILFATPTYKGIEYPGFLDSLEATVELCKQRGHDTEFMVVKGCCYIQEARNKIVQSFMESNADVLFFLDDDIEWSAESAIELIEMDEDVVAGIYPLKQEKEVYPVVMHVKNNRFVQRYDGCILASGLPTGFMCISRRVIETLQAAYPNQKYAEYKDVELINEQYDLFPQGVRNGRWVGEDYAFCNLWTDIGGELWVKPDINFKHAGYPGNLHQFLLRNTQ